MHSHVLARMEAHAWKTVFVFVQKDGGAMIAQIEVRTFKLENYKFSCILLVADCWYVLHPVFSECPSRISCFAGVSCVLGQDNETNCGSCPDGLTGDGIHCHPGM